MLRVLDEGDPPPLGERNESQRLEFEFFLFLVFFVDAVAVSDSGEKYFAAYDPMVFRVSVFPDPSHQAASDPRDERPPSEPMEEATEVALEREERIAVVSPW